MTKQIVIKLNEKKFGKILSAFMDKSPDCKSYSELIAKLLFKFHLFCNEKQATFDNKTIDEFVRDKLGQSYEKLHMGFLRKYNQFLSE